MGNDSELNDYQRQLDAKEKIIFEQRAELNKTRVENKMLRGLHNTLSIIEDICHTEFSDDDERKGKILTAIGQARAKNDILGNDMNDGNQKIHGRE